MAYSHIHIASAQLGFTGRPVLFVAHARIVKMGVATAAVRPVLLSLGRGSWKLARGQLHHRPVSSGEPFFTISSHTYIHPVAKLSSSSSCPNRDGRLVRIIALHYSLYPSLSPFTPPYILTVQSERIIH